jgi:acyl carrier protein
MPDLALYDKVGTFFSERLNVSVSSYDADLFETGILDSLTFVDLVLYLEQEFDVRVGGDELELENFRSVEKIAAFAAAHSGLNHVGAA